MHDWSTTWCERGDSLTECLAALLQNSDTWINPVEFRDAREDEVRAAFNLWLLTGLRPYPRDVPGQGQGLIDIVLTSPNQTVEAVEVLSTQDSDYLQDVARAVELTAQLNGTTPTPTRYSVQLERDWTPPLTRGRQARRDAQAWKQAVDRIAAEAQQGHPTPEALSQIQAVFPGLTISPSTDFGEPGFQLDSWNAAVPEDDSTPYLDRLSTYLSGEERPVHHLEKLKREANNLGAQRSHLYLLVASAGRWGGLFPASPSYFQGNSFVAPESLTDLWLDGGNGLIFHWQRDMGWRYHETSGRG